MLTNENGNVVAVGYMIGMNTRNGIGEYIFGIKFSKNGTKNDYLFGNVCVLTVTMPGYTPGASELYENWEYLKGQPIAIEFKHKGDNYWAPVSVKVVDEDDPEELKKVTVKDARFMMDRYNSEKEKSIMNWCQVLAEHTRDTFKPGEGVIPDECIEDNFVKRKYDIKTKLVNDNNFNFYLNDKPAAPCRGRVFKR